MVLNTLTHRSPGQVGNGREGLASPPHSQHIHRDMVMATESLPGAPLEGRRYPSPLVKQDLAKLGKDAESRRAALGSLRAVVEEHLQGPALTRFMHQLEDSSEGRSHAAAIISDLARVHGDRLSPHIPRLLQILAHTLLASAACPALQSECAKAVTAIGKHSGGSSSASAELVLKRLCLPLIALLSHKVELLSAGAAACLSALVQSETWKFANPSLVSKLCLKSAMALASRSAQTVPHLNLLRALAAVNSSGLAQFCIPLLRLLNQEVLLCSSASWQLRLAAIQLMESLFKLAEQSALGSHLALILQTLAKCRLDKMPHVRKAAMNALRTADAVVTKGNLTQKLTEDLPQAQSHTEPSSPLRHSLDPIGNIEDLFSGPLSSPMSQRSHALFLSPRTLSELAINSPSSNQLGSQTPVSDHSPGRDDSDYFCAYFFDTKENVSCRKIVHHIHDTAIGLATPPNSTPKQSHKVAVPPLPLSSVVHHDPGGHALKSYNSQSAGSTLSSITRHVTVLDSHAELVASCEKALLFSASVADDVIQSEFSLGSGYTAKPQAAAASENFESKSEAASNVDSIDKLPKSQIEQISAEQRIQAMEDLQSFSTKLLEIREGEEGEEEEEDANRKQHNSNCEHKVRIEESTGKEDERQNAGGGAASDHEISGDGLPRLEERIKDLKEGCPDGMEVSSQPDITEGLAGKDDQETVEASGSDWSVRNNPIADAQVDLRPKSEVTSDSIQKSAGEISDITHPRANASSPLIHDGADIVSQPATMNVGSSNKDESDQFKEAEEEVLESCKDEASETEDECGTKKLGTPRSSILADPIEIDEEGIGRPLYAHHEYRRAKPSKLRGFLIGSTACVIPIAMVTMAKLFYLEFVPQEAAVNDIQFMPPT